jgi:hypothetical protein
VAAPAEKAEVVAPEAGRAIRGHQRRLDGQRARAAHEIDERRARAPKARPIGEHQDGRRQVLLERRGGLARAPASTVQALAREIDADRRVVVFDVHVDPHARPRHVDRRARAGLVAQPVDDRVLGLERAEARVLEVRAHAGEVDRQGRLGSEVLAPRDRAHALIERLRVGGGEAGERQQHAVGHARPETDAIGGLEVTAARHARAPLLDGRRAQRPQLGAHQRLERSRGCDEQMGHDVGDYAT